MHARELKRREKQRAKDAKKSEKAASAPPKAEAKAAAVNEDELNPNVSGSSAAAYASYC